MDLISFQKYLQHEKRYSVHTVNSYLKDLEQFDGFIAESFEDTLEKATHQHIRSWIVDLMDQGLNAKTVNRKISALRTFYKHLLRNGTIQVNPVSRISAPKVSKKLPVFVDKDSMAGLLDEFEYPEGFEGARDRLVLDMFYQTGIRLSELIGLKESDLQNDQIKVLGKRSKERIIPVGDNLLQSIREYQDLKHLEKPDSEEYMLVTNRGKKLYEKFVYRLVNRYLSKATSLSKKSPHVLRHTFATHMLNNGADLNAIKEILGHANLSATQIYTHNSIEKLKQVHNLAHPRGRA